MLQHTQMMHDAARSQAQEAKAAANNQNAAAVK